ncbi:uncharacterized protein V1510DRAFT_427726 [Dipodascopsis tothii]|uniref:uncharacterized protein n=1 Tax=Dipodascopsis tothii TaxID=44089 RepID=UPI0034CF8A43
MRPRPLQRPPDLVLPHTAFPQPSASYVFSPESMFMRDERYPTFRRVSATAAAAAAVAAAASATSHGFLTPTLHMPAAALSPLSPLAPDDDEDRRRGPAAPWTADQDALLRKTFDALTANPTLAPLGRSTLPFGLANKVARASIKRARALGLPFEHSVSEARRRMQTLYRGKTRVPISLGAARAPRVERPGSAGTTATDSSGDRILNLWDLPIQWLTKSANTPSGTPPYASLQSPFHDTASSSPSSSDTLGTSSSLGSFRSASRVHHDLDGHDDYFRHMDTLDYPHYAKQRVFG